MKFECTKVYNMDQAILSMRNSHESHDKSDSTIGILGDADKALAQKLIRAGSEHRKFMRQIFVSAVITAPAYWWAEFDTYKVGVVRSSTSFMNRAMDREFTTDDFEIDENDRTRLFLNEVICELNNLREVYKSAKTSDAKTATFRAMRQLLPMSYRYLSTVTLNYEVILTMLHQRKNHRLREWSEDFVNWARTLPYADDLLFCDTEV